ncbi:MAG: hypothetical protein RR751_04360 [Clostridia bacterium]
MKNKLKKNKLVKYIICAAICLQIMCVSCIFAAENRQNAVDLPLVTAQPISIKEDAPLPASTPEENAAERDTSTGNLNVTKDKNESIFKCGNVATITSKVNGISCIAANNIKVDGYSEYSFLAGLTVNLNNVVKNDAYIAGETINLDRESKIGRDIYAYGSKINLAGNVGRKAMLLGQTVTVDNLNINGDLKIFADNINIGENVKIAGTLKYNEDANVVISPKAQINNTVKAEGEGEGVIAKEKDTNVKDILFSILAAAVVFLGIYCINKNIFNGSVKAGKEITPLKVAGKMLKGMIVLILVPLMFILLCITGVGVELAFIILTIYVMLMFITNIFFAKYVSDAVRENTKMKDMKYSDIYLPLIVIVALRLLELIPIVGVTVSIVTFFVGLCIAVDCIVYRPAKAKVEDKNVEKKTK